MNGSNVEGNQRPEPRNDGFIAKLGSLIIKFFTAIKNGIKTIFKKKNLKFTIPIIVVITGCISAAIIIPTLNKPEEKVADEMTDEEWYNKLAEMQADGHVFEVDKDAFDFYEEQIKNAPSDEKAIDITFEYYSERIRRGFVYDVIRDLDKMNINDMTCKQELAYYNVYRFAYLEMEDMTSRDHYTELALEVISRCGTNEVQND